MNKPSFNTYESTVYHALKSAYDLHEELGPEGTATAEPNRFGDMAMVADIGAERAMLDVFRNDSIDAEVRTEELGEFDLAGTGPKRLVVMDGLDGSSVYKRARGQELYGTMLALFEHDDPTYEDYLATGIALHSLHIALLAGKEHGLQIIDLRTGEIADNPVEPADRVFVDDGQVAETATLYPYFKTNLDVHGDPLRQAGYQPEHTGSSAAYYALVALGGAALVGESTRKGNLEFATAYGVVAEAGGVMHDVVSGESIGSQRFKAYGQERHVPILTARSNDLAMTALGLVDRSVQAPLQR